MQAEFVLTTIEDGQRAVYWADVRENMIAFPLAFEHRLRNDVDRIGRMPTWTLQSTGRMRSGPGAKVIS